MANAFDDRWSGFRTPAAPMSRSPQEADQAKRRANLMRAFGMAAPIAGTALGAVAGGVAGSIIPGAGTLAGAGTGAAIGGALGGGGGALLNEFASQQTDPEVENDLKRQAQMRAFQMLMSAGR